MNDKEYRSLKEKHRCKPYDWDAIMDHIAFSEFDYQVEEYYSNGKRDWEENGGRDIVDDISEDDVEAIINNFIIRYDNYIMHMMADEMRNAIRDVTGLIC